MPEMAEAMGQRLLRGAIVAWVLPDEPAQKAGMIAGDVILRFDGETFSDERALLRELPRGSQAKRSRSPCGVTAKRSS